MSKEDRDIKELHDLMQKYLGEADVHIFVLPDPNQQTLAAHAFIDQGKRDNFPVVIVGDIQAPYEKLLNAAMAARTGVLIIQDISWFDPSALGELADYLKLVVPKNTMVIGLDNERATSGRPANMIHVAHALRSPVARVGLGMLPSYVKPGPDSDDLETIARHRASLGMPKFDASAGWTTDEISKMAESIRTTGRMTNPKAKPGKPKKFVPRTEPGAYRLDKFLHTHLGSLFPDDPLTYIEHSDSRRYSTIRVYVDSKLGPVWVDLDRLVEVEPEFALHGARGETAVGRQRREKEARAERARQAQAATVQTSLGMDLEPGARQRKLFGNPSLKRKLMR